MGKAMVDLPSEGGKKRQLIGQADILPMLVARMLWSGRMEGRDILHYVTTKQFGLPPSEAAPHREVRPGWCTLSGRVRLPIRAAVGCQESPRSAIWGTALQEMTGKSWPRSTPTTRGLSGAKLKKRPSSGSGGGRSRRSHSTATFFQMRKWVRSNEKT